MQKKFVTNVLHCLKAQSAIIKAISPSNKLFNLKSQPVI